MSNYTEATMTDYVSLDENYYGSGLDSNLNDMNAYQMGNHFSSMSAFAQQGTLLGGNEDLNSFFSPALNGSNKETFSFDPSIMRQGQWDNGDAAMQMFPQQQGFPFPIQQNAQVQPQMPVENNAMLDPTWLSASGSNEDANQNIQEHVATTPEEVEKPKRGRPRKRKRKDPISEEEKQRKREAFLERNRRAASKCRKRKKESTEQIQARASNLDRESRLLTAELMQMRAEHANWLNIAVEHAKSCPKSSDMQAYLKAAESRLEALASFVPMNRSQAWDDYQAILRGNQEGTVESEAMSPKDTSESVPEMEYFDSDQYEKSNVFDEDGLMQASNDGDASNPLHSAHALQESISVSADMDRRNSTSSAGTHTENSSKDSAYFSTSRTPEDMKLESLDEESFADNDRPVMLPNPHLANACMPEPVPAKPVVARRPSTRRLRSSNSVHSGPADLDNPSLFLEQTSVR